MVILDAFSEGRFPGAEKEKPRYVATLISNIFIFKDKAYKLYKGDSTFFNENFNDLSNKGNRFDFTRNDFSWNKSLSPEIYLELKGIILKEGQIEFIDPTDNAEELVMIMNTIDTSNQFIHHLMKGKLSQEQCYEIGKQFAGRLSHLPKLVPLRTAYRDFQSRYHDVASWIGGVERLPSKQIAEYLGFIERYIEEHKTEFDSKDQMSTCVDIHGDNALYMKGIFMPMDTYAPKEQWLHGYKFINVYRLGTDIYVFYGKEAFEKFIKGYEEISSEKIPRQHDKFLIIYACLINWPYQFMLAEKEPWRIEAAEKYENLLEKIFKS